MFSAKNFLRTYGIVGVSVYGGATAVSISSIYFVLRSGRADWLITSPLEQVFGSDAEIVQKIHKQLGDAQKEQQHGDINNTNQNGNIQWYREGTYLGIATAIDSLVLPVKLAVCLPIARYIIKRRGR